MKERNAKEKGQKRDSLFIVCLLYVFILYYVHVFLF